LFQLNVPVFQLIHSVIELYWD